MGFLREVYFPERFWNSKEMVDLRTKKRKEGKQTYQAGSHDLLLVWTALVSPWMCDQQTCSGNVRRKRMRSDSLVSNSQVRRKVSL